MKSKFYLATAALALSFAACTDEVDLQPQSTLNQTSPITFTLDASDNLGARNYWDGYTLGWDENTHLSLFHSGGNAIYKAAKGGSDKKLNFTTQSMVAPGEAIMVHPADTTFEMSGQLYVKIPQVLQNGDSILQRIPFISEYINIAAYNAEMNQGAGYGKNYNIKLRQIATQLTMKTVWTGDKKAAFDELLAKGDITKGLEIGSVDLYSKQGFNVKMPIYANNNYNPDSIGLNWEEVYGEESLDQWTAASELDFDAATAVNKLTSKVYDREKDQVEFMILPQGYLKEDGTSSRGVSPDFKELLDNAYVADSDSSTITIDTYYGRLTIGNLGDDNNEEVAYYGEKNDTLFTVGGAFNFVRYVSTLPEDREQSTFLNEIVGSHVTLKVEADLANLDMSTVHIKNNQHLSDVIAVHEALQPEKEVTFIIDGDVNDVFEMSTENVQKLHENPEITLQACRDTNEECYTIRLTGATEVPAIDFLVTKAVNVILANETTPWTWTGGERKCLTVANLINEGILNVEDGAELALTTGGIWNKMINNGTMNIDGEVKQSENIENNGIINIGEGDEYYVNAEFTNEATELGKFGKIYNSGVFGNVNEGVINNYGYIQQVTKNSKTFITSNQTDPVAFNTPWSADNKYGTIQLFDKDDDNYSVSNTLNEGFIMIETKAATVTADEIGIEANYVKISGDCTAFDMVIPSDNRVRFIEINSAKEVLWTSEEQSSIRGLKVNEDCKLYIPKSNSVYAGATYLKGKIYKGGDFTTGGFVTYFGVNADSADSENVIKWK